MTNPELQMVESCGVKYRQELAGELAQHTCPGCVADSDKVLCRCLSDYGCFDHEERELIWLKAE